MASETVERLLKRSQLAWKKKALWDSVMREAFRYGMPQRNGYDTPQEGAKKGVEVFDSTAVVSTRRFANKLVNLLFPPYRTWVKLEAGPAVSEDAKESVNNELQIAQAVMFSVIHNMSAFQTAIGEFALDLCAGTGVMLAEKGTLEEPIIYEAVPEREVAFERGVRGKVGAKFRKGCIEAGLILKTWPDAKLPKDVTDMLEGANRSPEKEIDYEEITYTADDGAIYYDVILPKWKERIVNREKARDPWVTARFMKASGETQGRGPLLEAIADVKTINKLVELLLKNASLTVAPIYTAADDGVVNPEVIQLVPGEIITVARNHGHPSGASLAPLERAGDFNVGLIEYERLQGNIKSALLDQDLPPLTGQPRTATEILERVKQLVEDLGATYGRIVTELIVPLVQITLDLLAEWKLIARRIHVDGNVVKLVVTGPLAILQNLEDVETVVRALELSDALFGKQVTGATLKIEDMPAWIARKLGVPEALIRDDDERRALQKGIAEILANMEGQQPGAGLQQLAAAAAPPRQTPRPVPSKAA